MSVVRHHLPLLRSLKLTAVTAFVSLALTSSAWTQDESLGDYARKLQSVKKGQVLVTQEDGKLLLRSVDEIIRFSSQDSGLPRLSPVNRQLIGRTEAAEHFKVRTKDEAEQERRIIEAAVVLKKFGMLPPQFEMKSALGEYTLNNIAGFYKFSDKTMYLLNWVSPELQKSVMAHELTHALQDQNFHLEHFLTSVQKRAETRQSKSITDDPSEMSLARRAVIEGQATVVGCDYVLRPLDVSLTTSPDIRHLAEANLQASYSPVVVVNNAPRLLREIMAFPYREGLQFELALLAHGGREEAFQGAFRRPPLNTHQVLQPEAYFANERPPLVEIGDLTPVFGPAYTTYESGSLGELDVQIMSEEFGHENDIYTVARKWNGGSYIALKRSDLPADAQVTTADLALIYVSHWKTQQAAERFGQIYLQAMSKRLPMGATTQQRCDERKCAGALWEQHAPSGEGPVNVEVWPGNVLVITQSVTDEQMKALRPALLSPSHPVRASLEQQELSPRLFKDPGIQALSEQTSIEFNQRLLQQLTH